MGFNVYLPVGTMIGKIEFNKVLRKKKSDTTYNVVSCYMLPLISLTYFVKNYAREAHLRGIFRIQPYILYGTILDYSATIAAPR